MSDPQTPVSEAAKPETEAERQARYQEFVKARSKRNVMIALALVAFMAIIFTITAVRLTQNLADRAEALEAERAASEDVADE